MTPALIAAGALFLFFVPGHLATLVAMRSTLRSPRLAPLESVFTSIVFSVMVTTLLTHALGSIGVFSPLALFLGVGIFTAPLALAVTLRRLPLFPWAGDRMSVAVIALLLVLLFVYLPPAEFVFGGSDEGTYMNAAVHLAREGSLWFEDDLLQELHWRDRQLHASPHLPGFYYADTRERSPIVAHGFHFYTAFLAACYAFGGLSMALTGPCLLMILVVLAAYVLVARLAGPWVGLLVAGLLGVNPISVWFARISFAEVMCEFLLVGGTALALLGWPAPGCPRAPRPLNALRLLLAGAVLGAVHLVKIDFLLLPALVVVFVFLVWARGRLDRTTLWLPVGYGALFALSAVVSVTTHRVYFLALLRDLTAFFSGTLSMGRDVMFSGFNLVFFATYLVGLYLLAALLFLLRRPLRAAVRRVNGPRLVLAGGALTLLVTAYLYFVPTFDARWGRLETAYWPRNYDLRTCFALHGLALYLTPPGLLAGVMGVALLLRRRAALPLAPVLVLGLIQTGFALLMSITIDVGVPHFTSARRFLSVSVPSLLTGAVVPWFVIARGGRRRWLLRAAGLLFAAYLGWQFMAASWPHLAHTPWRGTCRTVHRLARQAPPNAVWLAFADDDLALRYLVPLRFLERRETFVIREWGSLHLFSRVLAEIVERGYAPVLLVGRGRESNRRQAGGPIFFPLVHAVSTEVDWSPLQGIGRHGVQAFPVRESTVSLHIERLPGAADFRRWDYALLLYDTW